MLMIYDSKRLLSPRLNVKYPNLFTKQFIS